MALIFLSLVAGAAYVLYKKYVPPQTRKPDSGFDPFMVEFAYVLFVGLTFWFQGGLLSVVLFLGLVIYGFVTHLVKYRNYKPGER